MLTKRLIQLWQDYETFFRYATVGVLGTAVDMGTLYFLTEWSHIDPQTSKLFPVFVTISFLAAVCNNYIFNRIWTFKSQDSNITAQFLRFLVVATGGFFLTQALMWVTVSVLMIWYVLAKLFTSLTVVCWNFFFNKLWTFRHREPSQSTLLSS